MSRRRDLEKRLQALEDIGKIMGSMKNLSYMETRKLARFIDSQRRVVAGIETAAQDFLAHHPGLRVASRGGGTLYLLIGAERGFCGNFNDAVLDQLKRSLDPAGTGHHVLVAVGTRLATTLEANPQFADGLRGASAAEEVPTVLGQLVQTLGRITRERGLPSLVVIHWDVETEEVREVSLLPPFRDSPQAPAPAHPFPPRLNLAPETFLAALIEQYLFAALHALLYSSLMAEHQQRVRHLEGALERVDNRVRELGQQRNLLRQEEITEEIELMLLNLTEPGRPAADDSAIHAGPAINPSPRLAPP
jgi:F-type H+-transporting ATPase subunit gamma